MLEREKERERYIYRLNCLCCLGLDNDKIGDVAAAQIVDLINEFVATV